MKQLILIFALLFSVISFAQSNGAIVGKLTDKEANDEPLPFANVLIKGTTKGTTTDFDGLYAFEGIEPGTYVMVYSFVGYETQEITVEVLADKVTEVNVSMGASAAALDEVVITTTTRRESEVALLLDQKKAVEIKQSIGADELSRKGVSDAAGAVAKISGVSKQEGSSNVYVRGLGDRYLNTTFNGLSLPSNDVNKKNIDLDLFASDVIENISVSKAYATDFYGDFAASNVNISSKAYTGPGFLELFTGTGGNTRALGEDFVKSEGTSYFGYYNRYDNPEFAVILSHGLDPESMSSPVELQFGGSFGKSFDFNNGSRLSIFGTGSYSNGFEYREGISADYTLVEKKVFDSSAEYAFSTNVTGMLNLNYRLDDNNTFKYNSLYINSGSDEVGYFGLDGQGRNRDAILNTDKGFYQMNVQFDQTQIFVNQLIGEHTSGKFDIDWGLGYNIVYADQPDRKRISLENYDFALDNDPSTNPTFYSNVVFDNQRYFQSIEDEEINGVLNLTYNASENFKLNFGYNGRSKKRNFENVRYGYDIIDGDYPVTNVNNFNDVFTPENLIINNNPGLYKIVSLRGIPGWGNVNVPSIPENTYQGNLNIYAGYLNAEINAGEKWLFVPGIRIESFEQSIDFDVINLGNQGNASVATYENFFLPSLNIRYALNDDMNIRASASQTVSVPEFKEIAPFVYEDVTTRIGGNPDLLDKGFSKILNLDLKYEWFMTSSEIISLGGFYKEINDPINLVVGADATGTQRYFRTGDKATVYGVELEVKKNVLVNENQDGLLSVGFNATYMHTEQNLYETIDGDFYDVSFNRTSDELQGASPLLLNADINYSPTFGTYKPVANLVFSYFADRIDALGSGQLGNVVEKSVPTLDFIWKNSFGEHLEINFSAKNILDPTIDYVRETSLGEVFVSSANSGAITHYKRGMDLGLQLKYKF